MAGDALKPSGRGSENQLKQPKCPNSEIHRTGLGVIPRCPGDGKWPLGTSTYLSLLKNIITGPVPPQIWMEQWIGISARTVKISDFGAVAGVIIVGDKRLSEVRCFIIWCTDVPQRPCVEFIWQKVTLGGIETHRRWIGKSPKTIKTSDLGVVVETNGIATTVSPGEEGTARSPKLAFLGDFGRNNCLFLFFTPEMTSRRLRMIKYA